MKAHLQLPWKHPLEIAQYADHATMALFYSGARYDYSGRYSYLCLGTKNILTGSDLKRLQNVGTQGLEWHEAFWYGWLGYGLKNQLENLPVDVENTIKTPDYCWIQPDSIYRFDHEAQTVECYGEHALIDVFSEQKPSTAPYEIPQHPVVHLASNMAAEEYKNKVRLIIQDIEAGSYYQANLTRKFFGELARDVNGYDIFSSLVHASPATYSAYIRTPYVEIISSSPEQYLSIREGRIISRPIKGSMKRGAGSLEDLKLKQQLEHSEKDRAENLMIVDLMRHDFSKICATGSVQVDPLFEVTTHALIHHLSSAIQGNLLPHISAMEAALACFPAGSMTGAPKIRAMQRLSELEQHKRGIYSGALGWFAGDGSAELSVVIRTIIKQGKRFEFQVGGGIVVDSTPELEYHECLTKALGMCAALGLTIEELAKL